MFNTKCLSIQTPEKKNERCLLTRCHERFLLMNSEYFRIKKENDRNVNKFFLSRLSFITLINTLFNSSSSVLSLLRFQGGNELNTVHIYLLSSDSSVDKRSKCIYIRPTLCPSVSSLSRINVKRSPSHTYSTNYCT